MTAPAATTDNAVWSSLPVPAILIDDGDRIVDVNPAAEGFLNSSAKALRGSGMADVIFNGTDNRKALGM
ncbi:PAS domain-containing protein, partial [Marinovum algicola]|uniref:PAS domain-containing protein n=1 Tax=Marinovum algicola TaxID=42444 RepID=UPI0024B9A08C